MKRLLAVFALLVFVTLTPAPPVGRERSRTLEVKQPEERGTPAPVICRPCTAPPGLSCPMICEPVIP